LLGAETGLVGDAFQGVTRNCWLAARRPRGEDGLGWCYIAWMGSLLFLGVRCALPVYWVVSSGSLNDNGQELLV